MMVWHHCGTNAHAFANSVEGVIESILATVDVCLVEMDTRNACLYQ